MTDASDRRSADRQRIHQLVEQVVNLVLEVAVVASPKIESRKKGKKDFSPKSCKVCGRAIDGHGNAEACEGECRKQASAERSARAYERRIARLALPERACACGCAERFFPKDAGQKYASRRCAGRARAARARAAAHVGEGQDGGSETGAQRVTQAGVVIWREVRRVLGESGPIDIESVVRAVGAAGPEQRREVKAIVDGLRDAGEACVDGFGDRVGPLYRLTRGQADGPK